MIARRRLTGFGAPLLALTLGLLLSTGTAMAGPFDGAWSVQAMTVTGRCAGPHRYPITIRNGVLKEAGTDGIDATGQARADGRVSGTIRTGLSRIAVTGRLRGASGSGEWSLAGIELLRTRLPITAREADVLFWLARGKSNRDIGEILTLSPRTITKHLEGIYAKLGVENRTAASIIAARHLQDLG